MTSLKNFAIVLVAAAAVTSANAAFATEHVHGSQAKQSAGKTLKKAAVKKQLYTCPMHKDYTSDQPGRCPKCGMFLVKVEPGSKSSKGR